MKKTLLTVLITAMASTAVADIRIDRSDLTLSTVDQYKVDIINYGLRFAEQQKDHPDAIVCMTGILIPIMGISSAVDEYHRLKWLSEPEIKRYFEEKTVYGYNQLVHELRNTTTVEFDKELARKGATVSMYYFQATSSSGEYQRLGGAPLLVPVQKKCIEYSEIRRVNRK